MFWKTNRRRKLILIVMSFLGVIYVLTVRPLLGTDGDNAHYIILAKSIISGQGFRQINYPDKPPETTYGFGYPIIIAPLVHFFPDNILALQLVSVFFTVLSVFAIFQLFHKSDGFNIAFVMMVLSGISHHIVLYCHHVLTEMPYLFFSVMGIYLIERYGEAKNSQAKYLVSGSIFLSMSYFIKWFGIILFFACFLYLLLNKKAKKGSLIALCFLMPTLPWILRNFFVGEGTSYIKSFLLIEPYAHDLGKLTLSALLERTMVGLEFYWKQIPPVLGVYNPLVKIFFYPSAIAGFLVTALRKISIHHIYTLMYVSVCILWPWQSLRFIVPLVPFMLYYFLTGILWFFRKREKLQGVLLSLTVCAIFLFNLHKDVVIIKTEQTASYYPPAWENYFSIADWVRENVPEEAIVMCRKPYLFYLRSKRMTVVYPFTNDADKVIKAMRDKGVDYVVLDSLYTARPATTHRFLYPAVKKNMYMFEPVAYAEEGPSTVLLRVKKERLPKN